MNENQIDYFLYSNLGKNMGDKRFVDFYEGTFSADEIVRNHVDLKRAKCFGFIFNTLERMSAKDRVGHWLCLYIQIKPESKMLNLKFLDSLKKTYYWYGKHVSKYIDRMRNMALRNNFKFNLDIVQFALQSDNSKICGGYACYGIMKLAHCKGVSLIFFCKF